MKQLYATLIFIALANLTFGQSFDMSLMLLGTNENTGNYEVALMATPNFTETNGNSADIGAVVSMSDNIFLQTGSTGFVNDCTTSGPPDFTTTCEYPIEREEWDASFLTEATNNAPGRFVYQLLRTETGEATFFDAESGTPVILAVFQIYNTTSGLPSSGDITLVDNNDPILDGTPNASFLNIRYDTATSGVTTDLYNAHDSSSNSVSFSTLGTPNRIVDNTISIYPNPAQDVLYISGSGQEQIEQLSIYDLNGRLVLESELTTQINVSRLSRGIYILELKSNNTKLTKRFIKQ